MLASTTVGGSRSEVALIAFQEHVKESELVMRETKESAFLSQKQGAVTVNCYLTLYQRIFRCPMALTLGRHAVKFAGNVTPAI